MSQEQSSPPLRRFLDFVSRGLAPLGWSRERVLSLGFSYYPPYLGAGVRVAVGSGFRSVDVEMALRAWNRNYFGTHFGGSLYSMCDPFFALILAEQLGTDYVVWDRAAQIRFRRPGRGIVRAHFEVSPAQLDAVRAEVEREGKSRPSFRAEILDASGACVAELEKQLHVSRRGAK